MAQFYDTMLWEYIKNPGSRGLWLDALAERELGYKMMSYAEVTQKKTLNFREVELGLAAKYSAEDVLITQKLYKKQRENPYISQSKVLQEIEVPLMSVLSRMEMRGIKIETKLLKKIGSQLEGEISQLEREIHELAGESFNINSPKQVGEILFEKLGCPHGKKTKTGYSVNAEVLESLAKEYPIAERIIRYRHYSKLLSTYINGLIEGIDKDQRIHTNYNQTIASTGRLSSTNPNLQNIPTWDGIAGEIRRAFVPDSPDDFLVAFDYSQVEVRLLALMSRDENLLWAFQEGRDIHQVTAEFIFWKKDISSTQRKFAKAVNFWVIYGISPFGLTKMIDITQKEAKLYIDTFYENYPKVREFFDTTIANCKKNSYVETLFGRRRYIPAINDRNRMIAQWAEREAINMPIQGSSADIIKIAMLRIQKMLEEGKYKSTMLLQVHDELVFNIVPEEKDELIEKIPDIMEHILENSAIPLKVDFSIGKNWKEAK
jgi:DNA polymerase-1